MDAVNAVKRTIKETGGNRIAERFASDAETLTGATWTPPVPDDISEDDVYTVLKNERRRRVLRVLDRDGGVSTLSTLAEQIAGWENGIDPAGLGAQQRKRVYIALYQRHLPRMDDVDVVEFDQRSGRVTLTDCGRSLWSWRNRTVSARAATRTAEVWPKLYGTLGLAGLLGLLVTYALPLPMMWSLTTIATVLFVSAVVQTTTPKPRRTW